MDSMSLFLAEVRRHRLLTRVEEVELAKQIERGDLAAKERMV
ncbi:MAG: RNA polymerase sigma factor RpoD, partial [Solirubrobacterales bacterium]|nr:RNA polymerase sigma factor RpoD [Solirubrobacterales bacterium]